jgi:hypothetical protein
MAQKEHDRRPEPLKPEEAAELEKALQSDDIAPVDQKTFGMRQAEIIIRVRNLRTPRQRKYCKSGITGVPVFTPVSVDAYNEIRTAFRTITACQRQPIP